jgi:BolA protein
MHGLSDLIYQTLTESFSPTALTIEDESHLHAGHAGAKEGGHYRVKITAQQFEGLNRIERHRLIYSTLHPYLQNGIHALAIHAITPGEAVYIYNTNPGLLKQAV